ncbi:MAG TPA: ferredoxin reductase family protein [Kineosporiaceae bacterium]|nr:ferredoxin reductase family protein [Kineosporiaceae bacterium]
MSVRTFGMEAPALPAPVPRTVSTRRASALQLQRDVFGAAIWVCLLVPVLIWESNGGIGQLFGGPADALTSVGRLTGLLAAALMLVQILLAARLPWAEQGFGLDSLITFHGAVGGSAFGLMTLHIVLITMGYAASARLGVPAQFWSLVRTYPGMLLAACATALIVVVVLTSRSPLRRLMRYETWHLVHLYAYLATVLALPHELWTGADFTSSAWARAFWWGLYGVTVGSVLGWRFAVPLYRTWRYRLVVTAVAPEGQGVVSVYVQGRRLQELPVQAGQFFIWRFVGAPGWTRGHPYSLSAAPRGNRLRITVKALGDGSSALASLRPGRRVIVEGPYGRLHAGVRTRRLVTLVANGIGITPMRALMEALPYAPGELTLIYRVADVESAIFREELELLAAERGADVVYVPGPRTTTRESWLPARASAVSDADALLAIAPHVADSDVYICGAPGWMQLFREAALEAGVPAANVHFERFAW